MSTKKTLAGVGVVASAALLNNVPVVPPCGGKGESACHVPAPHVPDMGHRDLLEPKPTYFQTTGITITDGATGRNFNT